MVEMSKSCDTKDSLFHTTKILEKVIILQQKIIEYRTINERLNHPEREDTVINSFYCAGKEPRLKLEIKNVIGDIFIEVIKLDLKENYMIELESVENKVYDKTKELESPFLISCFLAEHLSYLQSSIVNNEPSVFIEIRDQINQIIHWLSQLSLVYGFTLQECIEYVFNKREED